MKLIVDLLNTLDSLGDQHLDEVAPKGWEGTVKAMKKHKGITNPYALSWYMKGKGATSHVKEDMSYTGMMQLGSGTHISYDKLGAWAQKSETPEDFIAIVAKNVVGLDQADNRELKTFFKNIKYKP